MEIYIQMIGDAYRMCEETIQQGKKTVWAHAQINAGSRKTALNVGLKPRGINTVIQRKQSGFDGDSI